MSGRRYSPLVKRLATSEDLKETQRLRTSNPLEESALLVNTRLIEKHLASGKTYRTVAAAASLLLDALREHKKPGIMGQTSLLVTTNQGTYIVFVIDATTAGTQQITKSMTGMLLRLSPTLREAKRMMKEGRRS